MKLKIKRPLPDPADGYDGLTRAARQLTTGNAVYAVIALEAVHTEVDPEGFELAVVATVTAGEALLGPHAAQGQALYDTAYADRTGVERLPLTGDVTIDAHLDGDDLVIDDITTEGDE